MIRLNIKRNKKGPARTCIKGGFTLLEALVAISILMVAVVAPITIAQKGLSSAVYTKNQMIASYLAQDAVEFIKNRRDEATINNNFDWATFWVEVTLCEVDLITEDELGCQVDTITQDETISNLILPYSASTPLKKDTNGFYQYDDGKDTNYIRQIKILQNPYGSNPNEALVNVIVRWSGSTDNKVDVSTLIYNY